jgi:predicted lipoprotein with Yx(FWY)xxD motif
VEIRFSASSVSIHEILFETRSQDRVRRETSEVGSRLFSSVALGSLLVLIGTTASLAASAGVKVQAANVPSLGRTILIDGRGRALYHLVEERGSAIRCSGPCSVKWPPVIVARGTTVGAGVGIERGKLGTRTRPDGRTQATYGGLALYRFAGDTKGTVRGQGLGKAWYVIGASGRIITRLAGKPPVAGGTGGGDTGGGTTGGSDPGTGGYDPGGSYGKGY